MNIIFYTLNKILAFDLFFYLHFFNSSNFCIVLFSTLLVEMFLCTPSWKIPATHSSITNALLLKTKSSN